MLRRIALIAGADGLVKASAYLLLPVYLAHMTKVSFGLSSFQFFISAPLTTFCSLGLYVPLIRDFRAEADENLRRRRLSALICLISLWLVVLLGLGLSRWAVTLYQQLFATDVGATTNATVFAAMIVIGIGHLFVYAVLMAENVVRSLAVYSLSRFALTNGASLLCLLYVTSFSDLQRRMLGFVAGDAVCLFVFIAIILRRHFVFSFDWSYIRGAFRLGIAVLPSSLLTFTSVTYDRYLLARHWGPSELADYNLAMLLSSPLAMLVAATQVALVPQLYSAANLSEAQALARRAFLMTLATLIALALAIFVTVLVSFKLAILPASYARSLPLLIPCCLVTMLSALWHFPASILIREKRTWLLFAMSGFGLVASVSLLFVLVPGHGAWGAILANAFAFAAGLIACSIFASQNSISKG